MFSLFLGTTLSGIYIHIPFCKQACNYCDFHFSTTLKNKSQLIETILKEIDLRHSYLSSFELSSIYFGGGTPSLLNESELLQLIERLSHYYTWDKGIEITLEANPDDINAGSLKFWKQAGINRLSIGLQSFDDKELKWMNRAHTAKESTQSVLLAQDKGFDNLSIDLIYGSKFQTTESWIKTLQKAINLQTNHISSYNLTIENKTILGSMFHKGIEPAIDDELSREQFVRMQEMLTGAGFLHYEISNFAKDKFIAKHNSNYWLQKDYLGLGPSAHSFNQISRQWNVKNNSVYIQAVNSNSTFFEIENLSLEDRYNEYILTRLRTIWGCDVLEIDSLFGKKITNHFISHMQNNRVHFEAKGKSNYVLKNESRFLADGIASDLFI